MFVHDGLPSSAGYFSSFVWANTGPQATTAHAARTRKRLLSGLPQESGEADRPADTASAYNDYATRRVRS